MCRLVRYLPESPAMGESLTLHSIERVGSSTRIPSRGAGSSGSRIVCPISIFGKPERTTMSPAAASVTSTRWIPSKR
jgi:hypothetical protein